MPVGGSGSRVILAYTEGLSLTATWAAGPCTTLIQYGATGYRYPELSITKVKP
jgi:hypothetical protein